MCFDYIQWCKWLVTYQEFSLDDVCFVSVLMLKFLQDTVFDRLPPHFEVCWLNVAPRSHLRTPRLWFCAPRQVLWSQELCNWKNIVFYNFSHLCVSKFAICAKSVAYFTLIIIIKRRFCIGSCHVCCCWKIMNFRHLEFFEKKSFSLFAWRFSVRNSVHTSNNAHCYHIFNLIFLFQHHYVFLKITVIFNCYWNEIFHHTRTVLEPCAEGHFVSSKNAVSIRSQLFTTPDQNQQ